MCVCLCFKFSTKGEIFKHCIQYIPVFKNGCKTKFENGDEIEIVTTVNTCAFDSIFAIYSNLYFDEADFRKHLDIGSLLFHCKFTELVHSYYEAINDSPILELTSSRVEIVGIRGIVDTRKSYGRNSGY